MPAVRFFGPHVVRATFVMALFGWGVGFYAPPILLHAVVQRTGWPLDGVSAAVTLHFLVGAALVTRLPALHRRWGVGPVAVVGAATSAAGLLAWALAAAPWQLALAAVLSGAGWVTMGAAAVNAAISPWYERLRPMALARAYNGASLGGVIFSPLWVAAIAAWGPTRAAAAIGVTTVAVMAWLARRVYRHTPASLGQRADGDGPEAVPAVPAPAVASPARVRLRPWRDRPRVTLALAMACGLFAQIGLLTHLYTLLVPPLGTLHAGLAMGMATACAMAGRLLAARALRPGSDRRGVAVAAYAVQLAGSLLLLVADGTSVALLLLAVALFGSGIGNATSLPPLIAQDEFAAADVPRVVAGIVAFAQAAYAFAPLTFGALLGAAAGAAPPQLGRGAWPLAAGAAALQAVAIACLWAGRRRPG